MSSSVLVRLAGIVVATFLVGAAVFFGWNNGLGGLLFSPVLSLFGYYYALPVAVMVVVMWLIYSPQWDSWIQQLSFVVTFAAVGYGTGILLGRGASTELVEAFRFACAVSGAFAAFLVTRLKKGERQERPQGS